MKKAFLCLTGMATLVMGASPATAASEPVSSPISPSFLHSSKSSHSFHSPVRSSPASRSIVNQPLLEFDAAPKPPADAKAAPAPVPSKPPVADIAPPQSPANERLPIPWDAAEAPLGVADQPQEVPPPPPLLGPAPSPVPSLAPKPAEMAPPAADAFPPPHRPENAPPVTPAAPSPASPAPRPSVELTFDLPYFKNAPPSQPLPFKPAAPATPVQTPPSVPAPVAQDYTLDQLFAGETGSLVAVAVGSAEGTRTPEGGRNRSYYGHTDPGNGVWNLGTFSYQHGATSPEEADAKQLSRLKKQAKTLQEIAAAKGMQLTLEEVLNGIDLANQAPKAALDRDGYIDWLAKARAQGMTGSEAILWARVQSFFDPNTQRWNAPGLGNTEPRITHDQNRRMEAIASAIHSYDPEIAAAPSPSQPISQPIGWFSEEIAVARLFAQRVAGLFGADARQPASPPTATEPPIVQQILNLDL